MNPQVNLYKKNQVYTASQENLVLMLYDGARRALNRSLQSLGAGDMEASNRSLLQAQNIVSELMAGLNFEAGEIADNLYALYEYMHHRLIQANIKKDAAACREVLDMIEELRAVWLQVIKSRGVPTGNLRENKLKIS